LTVPQDQTFDSIKSKLEEKLEKCIKYFKFDGGKLEGNSTPSAEDLEDGDQLDIVFDDSKTFKPAESETPQVRECISLKFVHKSGTHVQAKVYKVRSFSSTFCVIFPPRQTPLTR
jgi:hypothetical protein